MYDPKPLLNELDGQPVPSSFGKVDGQFVVNPTIEQMFSSNLDLIYVGTEKEMLMIEGSADQLPEAVFDRWESCRFRAARLVRRALSAFAAARP